MKMISILKKAALCLLSISFLTGCYDLSKTNVNPNGVSEENVNVNLIMPTVLTEVSRMYLSLGYQDIAGVVQHTQKDAWFDSHNDYSWTSGSSQNWNGYYGVLRNNDLLYRRAVEQGLEFHQGVALVMKSFTFGIITDLWGDAPYTDALKAEDGGLQYLFPKYDTQETIYKGIIADLEKANELLSKSQEQYQSVLPDADVYYAGKVSQWQKFANSLLLRYYMRVSSKLESVSKEGIEKMIANPAKYPLITSSADDATMGFIGNTTADSWPENTVQDASGSNYRRIKMCATLVNKLQSLNDPRLAIWAKKVEVPLVVSSDFPAGTDRIVNGRRELSPDVVAGIDINTNADYVGLPPSVSALPSAYNLNPTPGQTSFNPHVSYLNEMYTRASGPLLRARIISAAEVNFILAEAALKGWNVGNAETHYNNGVRSSLETWTVAPNYTAYVANQGVKFNNTLAQVLEQKWIASWTAATEAWFDYRRTGLPAFKAGPQARRTALPLRYSYMQEELSINEKNANEALGRMEKTVYSQADNENSPWSKSWLLQGTGKPW